LQHLIHGFPLSGPESGHTEQQAAQNLRLSQPFSFIRTLTVGFGITPNLLTLVPKGGKKALAGLGFVHPYRRWGLSPRPENIGRPVERPVDDYGEWRVRQQGLNPGESACPHAFGATARSHSSDLSGRRSGPEKIND
jgi:hypothetical protein